MQGREESVGCHGMAPLRSSYISVAAGSGKGTAVLEPLCAAGHYRSQIAGQGRGEGPGTLTFLQLTVTYSSSDDIGENKKSPLL